MVKFKQACFAHDLSKKFQIFAAVHNSSKIRIEKLKTIYISSAAKILLSNLSPNLSAYISPAMGYLPKYTINAIFVPFFLF